MTTQLIATVGDHETQSCRVHCHLCPCTGGGTYEINPPNPQNSFAKINGKLILVNNDSFVACCAATLNASTTLMKINSIPVVRDGDSVSSPHSNSGVDVINQEFARCS